MKIRRKIVRQPRVEMLSLIDIVFLLLIFFIYAMLSMAVHRGLDLDLPESSTALPTKDDVLSISVKRYGDTQKGLLILVNDTPVEIKNLGNVLRQKSDDTGKHRALVFAEETISYQELFQVLDQVKEGGIEEISLQANKGVE